MIISNQLRFRRSVSTFAFLFFILAVLCFPAQERVHNLMPVPKEISFGQGKMVIDSNFRASLSGYRDPRLPRAAQRLIQRLSDQTGIPLPLEIEKDESKALLVILCQGPGERIQSLKENESYTLEVSPSRAELKAATPVGMLRGIETFLQLLEMDSGGFFMPEVQIQDGPRFPWRGLLIDSCRHWLPVEVIKRNLDGMAAVKLNVLHWHLSEDQGFRVECKAFPKLHQMGSDGSYYTQKQVREIIDYARDLGIRVVPEFDMPGHSTSWLVGYPELASAPGPYEIERHWGVCDPCLDPTRERVYIFLDTFIGEMARLFPDEYFHIGGDEVSGKHWQSNPSIVAFKRRQGMKDNHDLQVYFNKRIQSILQKYGKKMVGWDEIFHPDLPKSIVIQSWRGQETLAETSRAGYMGILSNGYYLDHFLSAADHYRVDPMDKEAADLNDEQKARILGGEACMWAEFISPETIDSRIWPRTAAIAERFWSPQDVKDIKDMYRRLEVLDRNLEWLGLTHGSSYPRMIMRLAGKNSIDSLQVLADIVEPVKYYSRSTFRDYTQATPLNRLVDAARPESERARKFQEMVEEMVADAPAYERNREMVKRWLMEWRDNKARLRPVLEDSFLLKEILPLAEDVASLAEAGLEAVNYLESRVKPSQSWLENVSLLLNRQQKPEYELVVMIIPALCKLVEAASGLPLLVSDDFESGNAQNWMPNVAENWQVAKERNSMVYQLIAPGPMGPVRAPASWSLLKDFDVASFVLTGKAKCKADPANDKRDVCIIFHFQDPTHFYYVHFSASSDDAHNIIALINDKDRVKINNEPPGQSTARMVDLKFHEFKVTYDARSGEIRAYLDDMSTPILIAVDKTLDHGLVGVGSFDDTASFDNIKLWGEIIKKERE